MAAVCRAVAAVLFVAALGSGAAQAWWDDSHGYRGVRAYAYGPPYRTGYFSGVTIRVDEWRYRAKISLAVKRGGNSAGVTVGFHPYDRPNAVFPLVDCHIADFRLMALWREVKSHLALLPARTVRLTLRLDREGRRHIVAESGGEPWLTAGALRDALPEPARTPPKAS